MKPQRIDGMLNFTYSKTTIEIVDAAKTKRASVAAKIVEREKRIQKLRDDYGITDKDVIEMLSNARSIANQGAHVFNNSYSTSVVDDEGEVKEVTIGAGVINNMLTEEDFIVAERSQVEKLDIIIRNLRTSAVYDAVGVRHEEEHQLTQRDLEYLGF